MRSNWSCRWRRPIRRSILARGHRPAPRRLPARQRLQRGRDLARTRIAQRDDAGRGIVGVDPADDLADAADIVGEVDHDQAVARPVGRHRPLRADQRTHRFQCAVRVDRAEADDLGDIGVAVRARRSDPARLRRGIVHRLHPERPARGRHRDQPVGAERRQENLEIFGSGQRPVGHDRHLAVDPAVDDEGAPRHLGGIGDEGADIGITNVERGLGMCARRQCQRQNRTEDELLHGRGAAI